MPQRRSDGHGTVSIPASLIVAGFVAILGLIGVLQDAERERIAFVQREIAAMHKRMDRYNDRIAMLESEDNEFWTNTQQRHYESQERAERVEMDSTILELITKIADRLFASQLQFEKAKD